MRARESALHDHRLGRVVKRLRMEKEIGEPLLVRLEECIHTGLAIPDFPCGDYLVTRIRECRDAAVEVVRVLRLHVLSDRCLAMLTHLGAVKHRFSMPRSQVWFGVTRRRAKGMQTRERCRGRLLTNGLRCPYDERLNGRTRMKLRMLAWLGAAGLAVAACGSSSGAQAGSTIVLGAPLGLT